MLGACSELITISKFDAFRSAVLYAVEYGAGKAHDHREDFVSLAKTLAQTNDFQRTNNTVIIGGAR